MPGFRARSGYPPQRPADIGAGTGHTFLSKRKIKGIRRLGVCAGRGAAGPGRAGDRRAGSQGDDDATSTASCAMGHFTSHMPSPPAIIVRPACRAVYPVVVNARQPRTSLVRCPQRLQLHARSLCRRCRNSKSLRRRPSRLSSSEPITPAISDGKHIKASSMAFTNPPK